MAASLVATALRRGFDPDSVDRVRRAVALAMEPRISAIDDDHHPAFLHPGRTVLVLLHDAQEADSQALSLAALLESRDPAFRVATDAVAERFDPALAGARDAVPAPGAEDLTERLVTLPLPVALATLAERLDHLRHEHLCEPVVPWIDLVEEVERAWLPVAERASGTLARRYAHWLRVFRRRL